MRSPADLERTLVAVPRVSFLGTLYRRVRLVALFGAKGSGTSIQLTRVPPEFLYAGGNGGRTNRFTYVGGPLTLYLAVDEATAQAETADGLPLGPTAVYGVQVNLRYILDLTDAAIRRQLRTSVAELTGPLLHKPGDPPLPSHVRPRRSSTLRGFLPFYIQAPADVAAEFVSQFTQSFYLQVNSSRFRTRPEYSVKSVLMDPRIGSRHRNHGRLESDVLGTLKRWAALRFSMPTISPPLS